MDKSINNEFLSPKSSTFAHICVKDQYSVTYKNPHLRLLSWNAESGKAARWTLGHYAAPTVKTGGKRWGEALTYSSYRAEKKPGATRKSSDAIKQSCELLASRDAGNTSGGAGGVVRRPRLLDRSLAKSWKTTFFQGAPCRLVGSLHYLLRKWARSRAGTYGRRSRWWKTIADGV